MAVRAAPRATAARLTTVVHAECRATVAVEDRAAADTIRRPGVEATPVDILPADIPPVAADTLVVGDILAVAAIPAAEGMAAVIANKLVKKLGDVSL